MNRVDKTRYDFENSFEECVTVGDLKRIINALPDDMEVIISDENGESFEVNAVIVAKNILTIEIADD